MLTACNILETKNHQWPFFGKRTLGCIVTLFFRTVWCHFLYPWQKSFKVPILSAGSPCGPLPLIVAPLYPVDCWVAAWFCEVVDSVRSYHFSQTHMWPFKTKTLSFPWLHSMQLLFVFLRKKFKFFAPWLHGSVHNHLF